VSAAEIRKVDLFGVGVSVTDYEQASQAIIDAALARRPFGVSALATHGLMEGAGDDDFRALLNSLDLVTPDGQPVRWAMNLLHGVRLPDRVYGPDLVGEVCAAAARTGVGVYLFGSTAQTLDRFTDALTTAYPGLRIVGMQPDRFREATPAESEADIARINSSGAGVVLVGRGCPRQERWVAHHRDRLQAASLAVGAAFDYYAGTLRRPPRWMQRVGLEWLFRLCQEPRRLFRRYAVYNTRFLIRLIRELLGGRHRPDRRRSTR
jgi:N-acetylglucosaminyldiphosphoundecaprenol N-acetyl-beta-D-mannosaminyltransferase